MPDAAAPPAALATGNRDQRIVLRPESSNLLYSATLTKETPLGACARLVGFAV